MKLTLLLVACTLVVSACASTLYEHYTAGGIHSGLKADNSDYFHLNGKPFTIFGGSFHYFRVVQERWNETLLKFKAAGLNTVQFYAPWNLHEDTPGKFDFETGMLNLAHFLELIKANDMFAIARVGPYICAEWEFGGFPSWLLRDPNMQLREAYPGYLDAVKRYQDNILPIIRKHQFSVNGGPVIALQLANEYFTGGIDPSIEYLQFMLNNTLKNGIKELIFESDPGGAATATPVKGKLVPYVLETINLNSDAASLVGLLKQNQPNQPGYISEFWPGWFDMWGDHHHTYDVDRYEREVTDTLFKVNGSINFYMFIGGTNFAFTNGGRVITSYDYDAPLSESANYTAKYWKTLDIYKRGVKEGKFADVTLPAVPEVRKAKAYGKVNIKQQMSLEKALTKTIQLDLPKAMFMEYLPVGKDYGQRYGYVLYRLSSPPVNKLEIMSQVKDDAHIMVDGVTVDRVGEGEHQHTTDNLKQLHPMNDGNHNFDILVENRGRSNGGGDQKNDRKGINGDIKLDGVAAKQVKTFCLDFNQTFVSSIDALEWESFDAKTFQGPRLYRTTLSVDEPEDTFLKLEGWSRGVAFVNNFNLGRYNNVGPQLTLYVPGPLLKKGDNTIIIFETEKVGDNIQFLDKPVLG